MVKHAIASYNMSWVGDIGENLSHPSEKHFHINNVNPNKRTYFLNAVQNALHFWNTVEDASVIGFQELNNRALVRQQPGKADFQGGFQMIEELFHSAAHRTIDSAHYTSVDRLPNVCPTVFLVWDRKKLGVKVQQYGRETNPAQSKGRPILIVLTSKKYILITLHAPNDTADSTDGMPKLRAALQTHFQAACTQFGLKTVNPQKIFITGDFNDPYTGIHNDAPLTLGDECVPFTYGCAPVPKSCCYNFNSACDSQLIVRNGQPSVSLTHDLVMFNQDLGDEILLKEKECAIVTNSKDKARDMTVGGHSEARSLKTRGQLSKYQFSGDYALTSRYNVIHQSLTIYRATPRDISEESDHEMVYLIFEETSPKTKARQTPRKKK